MLIKLISTNWGNNPIGKMWRPRGSNAYALFDDGVKPKPAAKKASVPRRGTRAAGGVYDGQMDGDVRSGYGVCMYANGDKYAGDWANDKGDGTGTYTHRAGDVYTGAFFRGRPHGKGVYRYANGDSFSGSWVNGKRYGYGKHTYRHFGKGLEESYEGGYENGVRSGFGVYTYQNGDQEQGAWTNGQPDGEHDFFPAEAGVDEPLRKTREWDKGTLSTPPGPLRRWLGY
jgi:hypothetical protein